MQSPSILNTRQIGFFALAGVISTFTHWVVYACAMRFLKLTPAAAYPIGFGFSLVASYLANRRLTFTRAAGGCRTFLRFCVSTLLAFSIAQMIVLGLQNHTSLGGSYIFLVTVPIAPFSNYILSTTWVFRASRSC